MNDIFTTRRTPEERKKNYINVSYKQIEQYIKNGSKGDLNLSGAPITFLPDNLTVGGHLILDDTLITSLPENLKKNWGWFIFI